MLYEKFTKDEELCGALEALQQVNLNTLEKLLKSYRETEEEQGPYSYSLPANIIEETEDVIENFYKIFTPNNLLTALFRQYYVNSTVKNKFKLTFGELIDECEIGEVTELLNDTINNGGIPTNTILEAFTLNNNFFLEPWGMVRDDNYRDPDFINTIRIISIRDLGEYLYEFSSRHDELTRDDVMEIYSKYYPNYIKDFNSTIEEIESKNININIKKDLIQITPETLLLYTAWRDSHSGEEFLEFHKLIKSIPMVDNLSEFRFLDENYYTAFKKIETDNKLKLKDFFQLFWGMMIYYGEDFMAEHSMYDAYSEAMVVNFDNFKEIFNGAMPIEWALELMDIKPKYFDAEIKMFYE